MIDKEKKYPQIYFSKCSTSMWRNENGRDREALPRNMDLDYLNEQCRMVNEGEKFFVCTCCGNAKTQEEYKDFVFAGKYCVACTNSNPNIRKIIAESKTKGYYD